MVRLVQQLFTLFTALSCIIAASASPLEATSTTPLSSRNGGSKGPAKGDQLTSGTLCALVEVKIQVGNSRHSVIKSICLCTQDGHLTDESQQDLSDKIDASGVIRGSLKSVVSSVGGPPGFKQKCIEAGESAVNNKPPTCKYPKHSFPVCAGGNTLPNTMCHFKCKPGHRLCGTSFCIQKHKQCVSGMPGRRSLSLPSVENAAALCPPGLEACYTADKPVQFGQPVGWECVDTGSNVESCGGCIFPVEGRQRGEDCSGLTGVSEVSCIRGKCQVESCMRGFVSDGTRCVGSGKKTFWHSV